MPQLLHPCLARVVVMALVGAASSNATAQPLASARVGLLDVIQRDADNNQRSVAITVANAATLFSYPDENRGDIHVGYGTGDDLNRGIVIVSPRDRARDNASGSDVGGNIGGDLFATFSLHRDGPGRRQWVAVHGAPSGQEMNADVAAVFFPFEIGGSPGFLAGHATNSTNNGTLDGFTGSPGIAFGLDFVDPTGTSGIYELDLRRLGRTSGEGVLLVCGGKNEDNYALSRANADGTFTIFCKDNGTNGASYENDPVAFVYVPFDAEDAVAGRIAENSGAAPTVIAGTPGFTALPVEPGSVLVRIDGVTSGDAGALLVSPEGGAPRNADNIVVASWDTGLAGYVVETRDLPGAGLQGLDGEPMFSFAYVPVTPGPGFEPRQNAANLVMLPDTQLYAQNVPEIFHDQTQWIADAADDMSIDMVLHVGDITNRNTDEQWQVARSAFNDILFDVPVILAQGNHDCGPGGNAADRTTLMNQYFPAFLMRLQPVYVETMEQSRIENSFALFESAGRKWIALSLEWGPRDVVLDWANQVLSQYEDRLAIVITHAYMYNDDTRMDQTVRNYGGSPYNYGTAGLPGGVSDGGDIYREVISQHPNVMMVLSGHIRGEGLLSGPTPFGNVVHEMLADYQGRADGGEGFLRIYELTPESSTVRVRTYSPTQDRYLTGDKSHFDLELVTAPGFTGWVCPPDIQRDGVLNVDDVLGFLSAFAAGSGDADLAPAYGTLDVDDVLAFLSQFAAGCP